MEPDSPRLIDLFMWSRVSAFLQDRRLHAFLWFCGPGVLVALGLRAWLMMAKPFVYHHPDTHDFVVTA